MNPPLTVVIIVAGAVVVGAIAGVGAGQGAAAAATIPIATDVRLGGDLKTTRFVLDLTEKVDIAVFTLANPYRVVVDLPQVTFKLPSNTGEAGRGLIKSFRYGLVMPGGSRIVLDAKAPVRVDKAFALAAADGQPARLVLDLAATDRDSFMRNAELEHRTARTPPPSALPTVSEDPRPLVVIDPGHGGIDNGTRAPSGELEKTIVLEFATMLRDKLERSGKYRVAMTRSDDAFIPLTERVRIARSLKASLLISIHADYLPRREGEAQGATVYTLSDTASDSEAARLAEDENKADVIAGVDLTAESNDVSNILIDLAQRETKAFSMQFARDLIGELKTATRLHKHPMRAASFVVLRAPDVPSVLLELGYVSTKENLKDLLSQAWREKTSTAAARAIDAFFAPRIAGTGPARAN